MNAIEQSIRFKHTGEDFSGYQAACDWCKANGYSAGSMQRGSPIGLVKGECYIAKWRNLTKQDCTELDGRIEFENGTARDGDAVVVIVRRS